MPRHTVRLSLIDPDDESVEELACCVDFPSDELATAGFIAALQRIADPQSFEQFRKEMAEQGGAA